MKQNHFCCKCHKTTAWTVNDVDGEGNIVLTCDRCKATATRSTPKPTTDIFLLSDSRIFFHD